ncbi:MerR family transcriptional regulator [Priestia aryabhattai]|uniref:MerR family transcriptional regulator n=1 Tax=Priestia aryabhattai TaxID=412384 RepID=UPI00368D661C
MDKVYTMKELINQCDVSEDTLRYYEKIELLPPVERKENGHRIYKNVHKETILMIKCLKKTGMSLQELKPILLLQQNRSKETEYDWDKLLIDYQKQIKKQQVDLQKIWDMIENKRLKGERFGSYS